MVQNEANTRAGHEIEKARWAGKTDLNLGNSQINEFPESLGQLTQLQGINLSGNKLTALPESLGKLTQLQRIDFSGNELAALPESLGKLTQLQRINLSGNKLTALPESLGKLNQLQSIDFSGNELTALPESLGKLNQLQSIDFSGNELTALPESLGKLNRLQSIDVSSNKLAALPDSFAGLGLLQILRLTNNQFSEFPQSLRALTSLRKLDLISNQLATIPDWIHDLVNLEELSLDHNNLTELPSALGNMPELRSLFLGSSGIGGNSLTDLPASLGHLPLLRAIELAENPLNPELAAAYKEGFDAVNRYLRARAGEQILLNEAKLILIGEGEVGKSCLLGALRGDPWVEGLSTTHGIEIKPVRVANPATGTEITLNGWDFGGQRVYRPTHQLFFSAPAVYLVVWKPREGSQAGAVKEWIKLVKYREPEARIIVVATHGGPKARQPDIDRQEIWDLFGKETVIDFVLVDSKPNKTGERFGIAELRNAIARVAAGLPEMGRSVPKHWQDVREKLSKNKEAYLPVARVIEICKGHNRSEEHTSELQSRQYL